MWYIQVQYGIDHLGPVFEKKKKAFITALKSDYFSDKIGIPTIGGA